MLYINAIGNISPQKTTDYESFLAEPVSNEAEHFSCVEPDYKTKIPARQLRRMSRIIRMGIYAAKTCLEESGVTNPDAILVGTGLGCLQDTEDFLEEIYKNEEGLIAPTRFIQSTHNTISSVIALMLKCYNYNFTYSHRGFSFESTLIDALLQVEEQEELNIDYNVLVGGIDEITPVYLNLKEKLALSQSSSTPNQSGEGAAFFMLGNQKTENSYATLSALKMIYKPASAEIKIHVHCFLNENGLTIEDIDLICLGDNNGEFQTNIFQNTNLVHFKQLCGEYKTASAFGMWLSAQILRKQTIPDFIKYTNFNLDNICNVLIYNNYSNINHSLILLEKA